MLKETEIKETIGFVATFISLVAFHLGGVGATWATLWQSLRTFCTAKAQRAAAE